MCTATWINSADQYDLFFNRDELHSRAKASSPRIRRIGDRNVLAPIDPYGGGSWIGTNDAGLTAALLNYYPEKDSTEDASTGPSSITPASSRMSSRGTIVLDALTHSSAAEVVSVLEGRSLREFNPFSLLLLSPGASPILVRWFRGLSVRVDPEMPQSSSSFRTTPVIETRVETFAQIQERLITDKTHLAEKRHLLAEYHRGHIPSKSAYSVCMHREDAKTQSFTHIAVDDRRVRFEYTGGSPCEHELEEVFVMNR